MMNILLPTDFSDNAQQAADFVYRMFDADGFRLILIHGVVPPRTTPGMMINITDLMLKDAERDLQIEKKRLNDKFDGAGRVEAYAKLGYLQDILPGFCTAKNAHLIVMGTRGANKISNKILGSNTEHIVRLGFAPLLAIPEGYEIDDVPTVCIATAKQEIPHVQELEKILEGFKNRHNVKLSVLHVLVEEDDKASKSLALNGMQIRVNAVKAKSPEEGITKYLKENHLDLLVVCHRHNSRLDYLFSRSTTKKLTGQIQVPLMILPG